ncbi:MAG: DoxX family protein [Bryobacteraceae bacterium]
MSKKMIWTGRILSWATGFFMFTSGINLMFIRSAEMAAGFATFGIPEDVIFGIGASALVSSILYFIPRTAVLGAILLTGYLGGAVATHVRIHDPLMFAPLTVGILIWLGLWLRDEQLRALIPLRRS